MHFNATTYAIIEQSSNIWALIPFPPKLHRNLLPYLIPFPFRCLWPPSVSPRIAIVSLATIISTVVYQTSPCHLRLFSSSLNTSRSSFVHSHSPTTWFYLIALPQGHICASSSARLLVYLLLLSGRSRSPTRNRTSAFSRSPLGQATTFSILSILLTPRKSLKCSSSFTVLLGASFPQRGSRWTA